MIKRFFGLLFAVAVLALLVLVVLRHDKFRSMLPSPSVATTPETEQVASPVSAPAPAPAPASAPASAEPVSAPDTLARTAASE